MQKNIYIIIILFIFAIVLSCGDKEKQTIESGASDVNTDDRIQVNNTFVNRRYSSKRSIVGYYRKSGVRGYAARIYGDKWTIRLFEGRV